MMHRCHFFSAKKQQKGLCCPNKNTLRRKMCSLFKYNIFSDHWDFFNTYWNSLSWLIEIEIIISFFCSYKDRSKLVDFLKLTHRMYSSEWFFWLQAVNVFVSLHRIILWAIGRKAPVMQPFIEGAPLLSPGLSSKSLITFSKIWCLISSPATCQWKAFRLQPELRFLSQTCLNGLFT